MLNWKDVKSLDSGHGRTTEITWVRLFWNHGNSLWHRFCPKNGSYQTNKQIAEEILQWEPFPETVCHKNVTCSKRRRRGRRRGYRELLTRRPLRPDCGRHTPPPRCTHPTLVHSATLLLKNLTNPGSQQDQQPLLWKRPRCTHTQNSSPLSETTRIVILVGNLIANPTVFSLWAKLSWQPGPTIHMQSSLMRWKKDTWTYCLLLQCAMHKQCTLHNCSSEYCKHPTNTSPQTTLLLLAEQSCNGEPASISNWHLVRNIIPCLEILLTVLSCLCNYFIFFLGWGSSPRVVYWNA